MAFNTILVHCGADENRAIRLGVATDLARRFGGHLVGLHVRSPFRPPVVFDSGFAVAMDDFYKICEENADSEQAAASGAFTLAIKGAKISAEWRVVDGLIDDELVYQSLYADLVVVGQSHPKASTSTPADLPQYAALSSGRPVLVVPHAGVRKPPGTAALLCWNASRESARAVTEALPLLKGASRVIVLTVEGKSSGSARSHEPCDNIIAWLGRHDIKATMDRYVGADRDAGDIILARAADHDADLIVMGIYGHSRLREMVLGGASRTMLSSMMVPVLMAH